MFINGGDFTGGAFGVVAPAGTFDTLLPHYLVGLGLMVGTARHPLADALALRAGADRRA